MSYIVVSMRAVRISVGNTSVGNTQCKPLPIIWDSILIERISQVLDIIEFFVVTVAQSYIYQKKYRYENEWKERGKSTCPLR